MQRCSNATLPYTLERYRPQPFRDGPREVLRERVPLCGRSALGCPAWMASSYFGGGSNLQTREQRSHNMK
eukprot:2778554-Amphidinium_carterae.1